VVTKLVTDLKVKPHDWLVNPLSIRKPWRIWYKYQGKLIKIMGMNREKNYQARVELTKALLQAEEQKLYQYGYNPISKTYLRKPARVPDLIISAPILEETKPFVAALDYAYTLLDVDHHTLLCVKSCLKYLIPSISYLGFDQLPVQEVRRKHIKLVMNHCKESRKLSPRNWNAYRSYLMMLFEALCEVEMVEFNPAKDLKKKKEEIKLRETLNQEERVRVKEHLRKNYPEFYRFVQIFFHSGGRRTELLALKVKDVNLSKGEYRTVVKKGEHKRHVIRVIKDVALPFWMEQITGATDDQYVFSVGLLPGPKKIREEQVTRRWRRLVKDKLGVEADLYSLKHLNTDETSAALDIEAAAVHNSHTSTSVTRKHYSKGEEERQRARLRKLANSF